MLIKFCTENYRSIRKAICLNLERVKAIKDFEENTFPTNVGNIENLLKTVVIYGTNGSGKSNLLKAADDMRRYILLGHKKTHGEDVETDPFLLDNESKHNPTKFEIEFIHNETRYNYSYSITKKRVLHECLNAFPKHVRQTWFERTFHQDRNAYEWRFSSNFIGDNDSIKNRTLENTLFLSKAAQENHAQIKPLIDFFREKFYISLNRDNEARHTHEMLRDTEGAAEVLKFLVGAGLDVDGINVEPKENQVPDFFPEEIKQQYRKNPVFTLDTKFVHKIPNSPEFAEFDLNRHESLGTKKLFNLAGLMLKTLSMGGILFIDELETSLHCKLMSFIVDLFNNSETNKKSAQLIFSTHNPAVLDTNDWRRDQVWFTDKTDDKYTIFYNLAEVSKIRGEEYKPVRKGQDIAKGILEGKFYTPPEINPDQLTFNFYSPKEFVE